MDNPFKFGTLVDEPYFTDRVEKLARIGQFLKSENHFVLISPRRYGKSSLVRKAVREFDENYFVIRPHLRCYKMWPLKKVAFLPITFPFSCVFIYRELLNDPS